MRWLIDENVRRDVARFLSERGDDVRLVPRGASDASVMRIVRKDRRVLLTCDADFANLLAYPPRSTPGIVILRIHPPRYDDIVSALTSLLPEGQRWELPGTTILLWKNRREELAEV